MDAEADIGFFWRLYSRLSMAVTAAATCNYLTFNGHELVWWRGDCEGHYDPDVGPVANPPSRLMSWPAFSGSPFGPLGDRVPYRSIPEGTFTTSPADAEPAKGAVSSWGPVPYRLHADAITSATWAMENLIAPSAGVGGFFIHGCYFPGTAGCIEFMDYGTDQSMNLQFDAQIQDWGLPIELYVDYKLP